MYVQYFKWRDFRCMYNTLSEEILDLCTILLSEEILDVCTIL